MPLRPLNDVLIIKPLENEFTDENPEIARILKEGLIKLPDKHEGWFKKIPMSGTIVSWGDKCRYKHKEGEKVIYGRFAGTIFYCEEERYIYMKEQDLLAKHED